ncbi:MAG: alkaline phosphatase family protein, partial [Armatimonadetes bacterium]|nr:alkaline phosphatase family protein [Armatimonadota bacterium]
QLLDFCGEQTTTFIVSDHGGGPQDGYLNMERFLMDTGLTVLKSGRRNFGGQGLSLLRRIRNLFPEKLLRKLPLVWYRKANTFFRQHKLSRIDWPHTRALNTGSYLGLRLNVKGREPQGCIAPEDYEEQRQEIQTLLQDYRHPATGAPVFQVHTREELYHGPYVSKAPDLVGIVGEGRIHLVRVPNPRSTSAFIWGEEMKKVDLYRRTGAHQMEGVLIAAGAHLHAGSLDTEAQLVDIVPTMLYALGLAVPKYCDGQVLTDLFASDFVDAHSPVYADIDMQRQAGDSEDSIYSQRESEQVKKRLRDLGYLD